MKTRRSVIGFTTISLIAGGAVAIASAQQHSHDGDSHTHSHEMMSEQS